MSTAHSVAVLRYQCQSTGEHLHENLKQVCVFLLSLDGHFPQRCTVNFSNKGERTARWREDAHDGALRGHLDLNGTARDDARCTKRDC